MFNLLFPDGKRPLYVDLHVSFGDVEKLMDG